MLFRPQCDWGCYYLNWERGTSRSRQIARVMATSSVLPNPQRPHMKDKYPVRTQCLTYDHRRARTRYPVRSAVLKHRFDRPEDDWATICEFLLLCLFCDLLPYFLALTWRAWRVWCWWCGWPEVRNNSSRKLRGGWCTSQAAGLIKGCGVVSSRLPYFGPLGW